MSGLGRRLLVFEELRDCLLEVADAVKDGAPNELGERSQRSTRLSQEARVGVKWSGLPLWYPIVA
jgi:hypothetical protein